MTQGKFPNGLQAAMTKKKIGPTALARLVDESKQNVDRWAKGLRRLQPEDAAKLAPHLDASVRDLLLLEELGDAPAGRPTTKIAGRAGADTDGRIVFIDGDGDLGEVEIPEGATEDSVAIEVNGYSQGFIADGCLIFYTEVHAAPTDDMLGTIVVIGTDDGEVLLKKLLRGSKPGLFDLESINGPMMKDRRVVWAAHVDSLVPPWRAKRLRVDASEIKL